MNDLDRVLDGVDQEPTVEQSVVKLLSNIAAKLRMTHEPGSDSEHEAKVAVGDMLTQNADVIADHVVANTLVADGGPHSAIARKPGPPAAVTRPVPAAADRGRSATAEPWRSSVRLPAS